MTYPWDPFTPLTGVTYLHSRGHLVHLIFRTSASSLPVVFNATNKYTQPSTVKTYDFVSEYVFSVNLSSVGKMNQIHYRKISHSWSFYCPRVVCLKRQVVLLRNRDFKDNFLILSCNSCT